MSANEPKPDMVPARLGVTAGRDSRPKMWYSVLTRCSPRRRVKPWGNGIIAFVDNTVAGCSLRTRNSGDRVSFGLETLCDASVDVRSGSIARTYGNRWG